MKIKVVLQIGKMQITLEEESGIVSYLGPISGEKLIDCRHYIAYYLGCCKDTFDPDYVQGIMYEMETNPEGIFKIGK